MRWLMLMAVTTMLGLTARAALAAEGELGSVVAEAVARSEELVALRARIAAAEASIRPAQALPDPMVSLMASNVPVGGFDLDRTPMTGVELGIAQRVPASSKRRLKGQSVSVEVQALQARHDDMRAALVRQVKKAYYDLQQLDDSLEIALQNKALAEDLLETAEARYATGKGLQQDVFRAQVRLSRMVDAVIALRERRSAAATRLNKLLYRPAAQAVPRPPRLQSTEVELPAAGEAVVQRHPRVREAQLRVEKAEITEGLAAAGLRPDWTLGFKYRIRDDVPMDPVRGDDFWSASVGMTLPWLYRRDTVDQQVKAAASGQEAAQADLAALVNELSARIEEMAVDVGRLDEQIDLVETGLLPQAEGALASSRAAYATGSLEFIAVIDNQLNLYNLQLDWVRLVAERARRLAELEYLMSGPPMAMPEGMEGEQ
jgi:cobalt-zinc-cadmium efflux system outer membrane protein